MLKQTTGNFYFMGGKFHSHDPEDKKSYREEETNAKFPSSEWTFIA